MCTTVTRAGKGIKSFQWGQRNLFILPEPVRSCCMRRRNFDLVASFYVGIASFSCFHAYLVLKLEKRNACAQCFCCLISCNAFSVSHYWMHFYGSLVLCLNCEVKVPFNCLLKSRKESAQSQVCRPRTILSPLLGSRPRPYKVYIFRCANNRCNWPLNILKTKINTMRKFGFVFGTVHG